MSDATTLCEAFQQTLTVDPSAVALRTAGDAVTVTWAEYGEHVRAVAAGLAALGYQHGDTLGIMLTNRPEFAWVDAGAMHLGMTPFSIYNTSAPEQVEYLFGNAGNRVAVTETALLPAILGQGWPSTTSSSSTASPRAPPTRSPSSRNSGRPTSTSRQHGERCSRTTSSR